MPHRYHPHRRFGRPRRPRTTHTRPPQHQPDMFRALGTIGYAAHLLNGMTRKPPRLRIPLQPITNTESPLSEPLPPQTAQPQPPRRFNTVRRIGDAERTAREQAYLDSIRNSSPPMVEPHPALTPMQHPPPQKTARPKHRLWHWYGSLHPLTQFVLGCLALIAVLFVCSLGSGAASTMVQSFQSTYVPPGAAPTPISQSNNQPRMGGQLANFVRFYGSPASTTPDSATFTDSNVQITAYTNASHIVNRISVSSSSTWTLDASVAFCSQFLTDGAQETNRLNGDVVFIDYNSAIGKIVLQAQMTTCLLFISLG